MSRALDNFRAAPVQRIALAGSELAVRTFGDGPPVLFVHGWPLSGITYRHLIEALRPHYRCIVPDLPGAGDTPWSPRIHETMTGYTELMHALIDHLQLERLALIGHDSGGGVARLLAAELGPRATCLVLQNTELPHHVPPLVRAFKLAAQLKPADALFPRLLASPSFRRSPLGFGECFGDRALVEGEFLEACVKPLMQSFSGANAMIARIDLGWTNRLPDVHARIAAPVHLFWGGADKFFPLDRVRGMQAQFKRGGLLEVVPNGKLYVHEEAPDALARFTLPLLQSAFSAARSDAHAS